MPLPVLLQDEGEGVREEEPVNASHHVSVWRLDWECLRDLVVPIHARV